MAKIIVIGDSEQLATFLEHQLQTISLLQENLKVNEANKAKLVKLQQDIASEREERKADKATIAQQAQQISDLTGQVNVLTTAQESADQEVGDALDSADASLTAPLE